MQYKNIQELYEDIFKNVEEWDKKHREYEEKFYLDVDDDVRKEIIQESHCTYYYFTLDIKNFIPKLSKHFEEQLLKVINENRLNKLESDRYFYLVYNLIHYNLILNNTYESSEPLRDDKYLEKLERQLTKKTSQVTIKSDTPQNHLRLFSDRSIELLSNFKFIVGTTKREKNRNINFIIDDLIMVVVCDNYIKDKYFKEQMRVTEKIKKFIHTENERQAIYFKTKKRYFKTIK